MRIIRWILSRQLKKTDRENMVAPPDNFGIPEAGRRVDGIAERLKQSADRLDEACMRAFTIEAEDERK